MGSILSVVELELSLPKSRYDDDSTDRLNRLLTVAILVMFSLIVTSTQYVGEPISCWTPAHFEDDHEDYANSYCWIRNTYFLPFDADIPTDVRLPGERRGRGPRRLPYYQWVPLILLVQALGFYFPYRVWTRLSRYSGLDLHSLVEAGQSFSVTDMTEIRDKTLMYMAMMTDRYLRSFSAGDVPAHGAGRRRLPCTYNCHGNFLVVVYLFVKLLYLINIAAQLFLLDMFLGTPFHAYGVEVLRDTFKESRQMNDWSVQTSVMFPRVTMCDLKVRRLGAVHDYNVQCVLPINLFNEKIFLFVWFWLVLVGVITLGSLVMWIVRVAYLPGQRRYVKRHLAFVRRLDDEDDRKRKTSRFVNGYLSQDGVFVLRLLAHNTSTVTATEFVTALWDNYKDKRMTQSKDEAATDV